MTHGSECPVCRSVVVQRGPGQRARYCSTRCRQRAYVLRRRAERVRAMADEHDQLARRTAAGERLTFGNAAYLSRRATELRAFADGLLERVG